MIRLDSHQLPKLVLLALLAIGLAATSAIPRTQELAVYPFSPENFSPGCVQHSGTPPSPMYEEPPLVQQE